MLGWIAMKKKAVPYLFLLPSFSILLVFVILPIVYAGWVSMVQYRIVDPSASVFVGLRNFERILRDELVWVSLRNTIAYSVVTVTAGILISLLVALIITKRWFRAQQAVRVALFLPFIMSVVMAGLIWSYLFHADVGLFNYLLRVLGVGEQGFLGDPRQALWCVAVMMIWKNLGYNVVIWSAGILGLPQELSDAAQVDGVSPLAEFWYIQLPLLRPVMMFLTILGLIGSFQSFDAVFVMTFGGPVNSTRVLVFHIWQTAFGFFEIGYATAVAWLLFAVLVALTVLQFKSYGKEEALH